MSDLVLQKLFDRLAWPMWIVDDESRPITMNRPASDLVAQRVHVHLNAGRLRPIDASATGAWNRALASTSAASCASTTVPVARAEGACHFVFTTLSDRAAGDGVEVMVALAGHHDHRAGLRTVQSAFGLTPGELRLLEQLVEGRTPKEACEELCISVSTVRSQLRALFAKTNTRRQAELVLLTQRFPSLIPARPGSARPPSSVYQGHIARAA